MRQPWLLAGAQARRPAAAREGPLLGGTALLRGHARRLEQEQQQQQQLQHDQVHQQQWQELQQAAGVSKPTGGDPAAAQEQLAACIHAHQPPSNVTTWASAMADLPTSMWVGGVWWSRTPRSERNPVTVVTQLGYNRVQQLAAMCKTWSGPVSAAVLLPLVVGSNAARGAAGAEAAEAEWPAEGEEGATPMQRALWAQGPPLPLNSRRQLVRAVVELGRLHRALEQRYPCQLDVLLMYELYDSANTVMLYPVNVMRNLARLQARTPLIGLFDVDMLVGGRLGELLSDSDEAAAELLSLATNSPRPAAVVLPAFETRRAGPSPAASAVAIADRLAASEGGKGLLLRFYERSLLMRFDPRGKGHVPTRTEDWLHSGAWYQVPYEERYEPWVIVSRHAAPWHDARFRGYGQNKVLHLEHLNASGFAFQVHPRAFLVHRWHPYSDAKVRHVEDYTQRRNKPHFRDTIYGHVEHLASVVRQQLQEGSYQPVLDPASAACRTALPWWGPTRGSSGGGA